MKSKKELLFSLSKDKGDFVMEVFRSGGKGGQHQNKTSSGVRIKHPVSGAVGESREERSQHQNKMTAFERLCESKVFKDWHKRECARQIMGKAEYDRMIARQVEEMMKPENLLIETYDPDHPEIAPKKMEEEA